MNQSDFAKLHSVSRKTVTTWKARGWLVLAGEDIDVDASNSNLERYRKTVTRPDKKASSSKQGNKTGNTKGNKPQGNKSATEKVQTPAQVIANLLSAKGPTLTRDEALTMKENFLALLTQLDYEIKSGQVLPHKDMIEAVGKEYSRMRTRLTAIAPEHGPRLRVLASTTSDVEFVAALQEVIYEAMEELSLDNNNEGDRKALRLGPVS